MRDAPRVVEDPLLNLLAQDAKRRLSSAELELVLEALPVPLSWASLPDGRIRFMNQAFRRCYGYTVEDFADVADWMRHAYVRAEDRHRMRGVWQGLWQAGGRGHAVIAGTELEVRCADGTLRTALHRGIVLYEIGIGIATFDDITLRKQAERAAWRFAYEDCLTGLPNRRYLQQRWAEAAAQAEGEEQVLALLDLDAFKPVNDRYGHEAGDTALVEVAARLRALLRPQDAVCRLGGDEFALLLGPPAEVTAVEALCARLREALSRPLQGLGGHRLDVTLGLVRVAPAATEFALAYRRADAALYRAKHAGKGGWRWAAEADATEE